MVARSLYYVVCLLNKIRAHKNGIQIFPVESMTMLITYFITKLYYDLPIDLTCKMRIDVNVSVYTVQFVSFIRIKNTHTKLASIYENRNLFIVNSVYYSMDGVLLLSQTGSGNHALITQLQCSYLCGANRESYSSLTYFVGMTHKKIAKQQKYGTPFDLSEMQRKLARFVCPRICWY